MKWKPARRIPLTIWADEFRYLSPESSAEHGKYRSMRTPWVRGIQAALSDPNIERVVNMKASQTAWTDGVIVNYIMWRIDLNPCGIIGMFAKTQAADEFVDEKFTPAVIATPQIKTKIDVETTRKAGNKKLFKKFSGGFLKLVGSNSPSSVKSTSAPVVFIEEPDDANTNVKGQGDTIKLLEDRTKTFEDRKIIYGGTPTIKNLSAIEDAYNASDKRMYYIPCHDCGESHVLDWDNVTWQSNSDIAHEIYGTAQIDTAAYACPHCGSLWDDDQKNENVQAAETTDGAGWIATAEFNGTAGFGYVSELYAPFHASRFSNLLKRYLEAQHKLAQGDETDWVTFVNTCLGKPYEYANDNLDEDALREKAEDYTELLAPPGALKITVGIDVQHDRFAVIIRAWGRGQESWLLYWGEIATANSVTDTSDPAWQELEQLVYTPKQHEAGYNIPTSAVSIDASDGQTSDAVYAWVRKMNKKYRQTRTMAIKGASDNGEKEIFTTPRTSIDHRTPTKASKYGLRVFIVGTNKAKDLFTARLQLTGSGPGRIHYYRDVRQDYYSQITSEIKAPSRRLRGRMTWQQKSGVRNEGLDCEVYALHAALAERIHLLTPAKWDDIENNLKQVDLFSATHNAADGANQKQTEPATNIGTIYGNVDQDDQGGW